MKNKNITPENWTIKHPLLMKTYIIPYNNMTDDEYYDIDIRLYNLKEKLSNEPQIKQKEDFFCSDDLLTIEELNERLSPSAIITEVKNTHARKYPYEYHYIENISETKEQIIQRKEQATLEILKIFFELDKKYCQ